MDSEKRIKEIEDQLARDNKAHNNRVFHCKKYRALAESGAI